MSKETLEIDYDFVLRGKTVSIEVYCADSYMAHVLLDHLRDTIQKDGHLTINLVATNARNTHKDPDPGTAS